MHHKVSVWKTLHRFEQNVVLLILTSKLDTQRVYKTVNMSINILLIAAF